MRVLFREHHLALGLVPGPARLAQGDGVIWLAGGGRGESAVLRFADGSWRSRRVDANGLRAVLPIDAHTAVLCGEHGYLAVMHDDDIAVVETDTDGCLYSLARDPAGGFCVGGDDGWLAHMRLGDRATRRLDRQGPRLLRLAFGADGALLLATSIGLLRRHNDMTVTALAATAPLTDLAFAPDGTLAISGDGGQLYLVRPGAAATRCSGAPMIDLEAIAFDPRIAAFVVVGERGWIGVLQLDGTVAHRADAKPPFRLSSVLPLDDGTLYAGWAEQGPPYRMRGAVYFDGAAALDAVAAPPKQALPPRRERSFAVAAQPLTAAGAIELSLEEAKARLPEVSWPDTDCVRVRFYDGDVRVADGTDLLAENNPGGYCVAIRGNLVVDGVLEAAAGGDGYDSVLVIAGDAWAEAAVFRGGIKASLTGVLEVGSVVICSHGDNGGTLWAKGIRAQVVHYSLYFPKPDATLDAFCVGDVYGETSFAPDRAAEVFVPEVLDDGTLDEGTAADWLSSGRSILR